MLIVNDDHRRRAGMCSLDELCPYYSSVFAFYPLIMSDDAARTAYHVACTLELAMDLLVDLYTFFSPPTPYALLFTLTAPAPTLHSVGIIFILSCLNFARLGWRSILINVSGLGFWSCLIGFLLIGATRLPLLGMQRVSEV